MSRCWLWVALVACSFVLLANGANETHSRRLHEDSVQAAIVNGYNAPRRYSWMVSLRDPNLFHFCGATLIHPRIVLSAAHCFINDATGQPYNSGSTQYVNPTVFIGYYNSITDVPNKDYDVRKAIKTVPNPNFVYEAKAEKTGEERFNNDIALLLLDKPSSKPVIQLPPYRPKEGPTGTYLGADKQVWAAGFGTQTPYFYDPPIILQQAAQKLQTLTACTKYYLQIPYFVNFTSPKDTLICSGNPVPFNKSVTCQGDSGGPLFYVPAANTFMQIGLDSFGKTGCIGSPNVFTNIAQLRPWIDATMKQLLAPPPSPPPKPLRPPPPRPQLRPPPPIGKVYGDPYVKGFDGSTKTYPGKPGQTMNILTSSKYSLVGTIKPVSPPFKGVSAVADMRFKWTATVRAIASGQSMSVWVNGRAIKPGTTMQIPGGSVRFLAFTPGMNHALAIVQPGLSIRMTQPYYKKYSAYATWIDVYVTLTGPPVSTLTGVLGSTFKAAASTASTGKALSGTLSARVQ
ncbi:hypothetical protein ABPG77_005169 [Micractinium sp. CCAP 211/92]